jgi:hypothetical protein
MLGLRFSITVGPFFIRVDLRNALAAPYSTECSFIAVVEERKAGWSEPLLQLGHFFFTVRKFPFRDNLRWVSTRLLYYVRGNFVVLESVEAVRAN